MTMSQPLGPDELDRLKEMLLTMASYAEAAVNRAVKSLIRRDDELARRTHGEDDRIDALEMEIDRTALGLLEQRPQPFQLRFITVAMKISNNLERVGDEATTISRRVIELAQEPAMAEAAAIPPLAGAVLAMLKEALDSFVTGRVDEALAIIPRDQAVDETYRELRQNLIAVMTRKPTCVPRCLALMVIAKSLERIGDHATNVAEEVVYLYEGRDIRHPDRTKSASTS
jgi:phosphate transport system protein